jgi:hypothetical protein
MQKEQQGNATLGEAHELLVHAYELGRIYVLYSHLQLRFYLQNDVP